MMSASKMAVDSDLREFFRRSGAHPDRKGQLVSAEVSPKNYAT